MNSKFILKILPYFLTSAVLLPAPVNAIEINQGELTGNFDTTISLGASWRVENRDLALVGVGNGGTATSTNGDDGNRNYDKGLTSQAVKVTHDLDLNYNNIGAFFRVSYFYDFENKNKGELTQAARDNIGSNFDLLDAFIEGRFTPGGKELDVRVGSQVVSWGESTFIQNSINTINPVDVSKFRVPGAELREGLIPTPMIWGSLQVNDNVSAEAVILTNFKNTKIDSRGTYFSTNDFASDGGDTVWVGYGQFPEGTPGTNVPRAPDRKAKDSGEFGLALRYFSPELNDTEFGLYYLNYHSRLPLISANSRTGGVPTASYFVEYPEDVQLLGISFNTSLNIAGGIALQGEYSYRKDAPLQVEDIELLLCAVLDPRSQLHPTVGCTAGKEISGYRQHDVGQLQFTATKVFGAQNPFKANQWVLLAEVGATKVYDLPDKSVLRYEGPGTTLPGLAGVTAVGTQTAGWADDFSWGYRIVTRLDYNAAIGSVNLSPRIAFAHDVNGTSPGPGGNFIEGRKALTLGLGGDYLNKWSGDLSYTRYYGAGNFNQIHDRDFVSMNVKYSF